VTLIAVAVEASEATAAKGAGSNGFGPGSNGANGSEAMAASAGDGSEAKETQAMKESAVKESRADGVAAIGWAAGGSEANGSPIDALAWNGSSVDSSGLDATASQGGRLEWVGGVDGLDCGRGIDRFDLPFSRVGGRRFDEQRPRLPAVLPGCLRGSSTPAAGRWPGLRGLLAACSRISWSSASTPWRWTQRVESLQCCLDPGRRRGRDQFLAQWSLFRSRRGEGQVRGGKREGHGGTQLSLRSSNGRIQEEQARSQHCKNQQAVGAC